jgi:2-phospho-L-lactate transferase/gluconeogenesis factor (CofD/UPF0052 family)
MKTTIISGGTGSVALKTELSKFVDRKNLVTLINCYDNGLSTGLVRKVFNGEILGPSDARKQQFLDYEIYRDEVKTELSEYIYEKLKGRFTIYKNPEEHIKAELSEMPDIIKEAVDNYFKMPLASQIKYIDFSLANIIYGSMAYTMCSLQSAVDCMADLLNLPRNIIINDDESLFLCALTEKGTEIYDESEIVDWSNPDNKIVDIFFTDIKGNRQTPTLTNRAKKSLIESDVIICSSGTQFSSLIPTYVSEGFVESIENKKVYIIKNAFQDKDMIGYTHEEEMAKILEYIPEKLVDKIFSHVSLGKYDNKVIRGDYITNNKHNHNLVADILSNFYNYNGEANIIFDYDDTIFSRNDYETDISLENIKLIGELKHKTYLFTGKKMSEIDNNLKMSSFFTCYGASVYDDNREKIISYSPLTSSEIKQIIDVLKEVSFNFSKIENRDDCIISLRFLDEDYRELLFKYAELKLTDLKVIKGGKKTIDIMKKDNDKMSNFKKHFNENKDFFYVGDELDGNDEHMIKELNSLHVKNVLDTNTFLKYILLRN